ncbi:MAG TPA: M12 family metallo-peptidase [Candidatus Nanoarchaeia archaeon]|nr:M12 family metallo-peptidase [Candidatus Nanoarchaeia archaeon]
MNFFLNRRSVDGWENLFSKKKKISPLKRIIGATLLAGTLFAGGVLLADDYINNDFERTTIAANYSTSEARKFIAEKFNYDFNRKGYEEIRILNVTIAADEELICRYESRGACFDELEKVVDAVSEEYRKKFGIYFQVKNYATYESDNKISYIEDRHRDAKEKVERSGTELKFLFTGQEAENSYVGFAPFYGNSALIYITDNAEKNFETLAHEIGHVFGAEHVNDKRSVMYWSMAYPTITGELYWDDATKKVIARNKQMFFLKL